STGAFRVLRANQRKFWTCRENAGGQSRSAWKVRTSRRPLILLKSHCTGVCCACSSTSIQARWNTPQVSRSGTRKHEGVIQEMPTTWPRPASADWIQRRVSFALRRLRRRERLYHVTHNAVAAIRMTPRTAIWEIKMLFYSLLDVTLQSVSRAFLAARSSILEMQNGRLY